jgi:hypothetical protein
LLDAHDALIKACVDSVLTFAGFAMAYGRFPHSYSLDGKSSTAAELAVLRLFRRRIAFHGRVSAILSGLHSGDDPVDIPYEDAGRFLPAVGLMRLRELVARYPGFEAEPDIDRGESRV